MYLHLLLRRCFEVVEQYRLVEALLQCIQEVDSNTGQPICNQKSCPVMSAGR